MITEKALLNKSQRRYDLDWLRVLAFTLLIFYHAGLIFSDWIISNEESSLFLSNATKLISQWRMPLICVISGAGVFFALKKRSSKTYLSERFQRLLLPLVIGALFIVPPQLYYHRIFIGEEQLPSYLDFQKSVFQFKIFPQGNLHWAHLWFIAYLLMYCVITLPLFNFFRSVKGKAILAKVDDLFSQKSWLLLFLTIPLISYDIVSGYYFNNNGNRFITLMIYFIYGYTFFSQTWFRDLIKKNRKSLLLSVIITSAVVPLLGDVSPEKQILVYSLCKVAKNLNAILWVFTLVGFASVYLNFNHSILKYANEAVYPFYILHQSAMVVVGFYIVQWPLDIASKYILITVGTFLICWLIYEFIIRRNNILRLLFGLKLLERKLVSVSNEPAVALVTDGDIYTNNKTLKNKTIKT
jgi:hypothetical protein